MGKKSKLRLQVEEMCKEIDWELKSNAEWGKRGWTIFPSTVDLADLSKLIDDDNWTYLRVPNLDAAEKVVSAFYTLPDRQEAIEALDNLFDIRF